MKIRVQGTRSSDGSMQAEVQQGKKRRWVGVKVVGGESPKDSVRNTLTALQAELSRQGVAIQSWTDLPGGEG